MTLTRTYSDVQFNCILDTSIKFDERIFSYLYHLMYLIAPPAFPKYDYSKDVYISVSAFDFSSLSHTFPVK